MVSGEQLQCPSAASSGLVLIVDCWSIWFYLQRVEHASNDVRLSYDKYQGNSGEG